MDLAPGMSCRRKWTALFSVNHFFRSGFSIVADQTPFVLTRKPAPSLRRSCSRALTALPIPTLPLPGMRKSSDGSRRLKPGLSILNPGKASSSGFRKTFSDVDPHHSKPCSGT